MRIASYNIEWMQGLFDRGKLCLDNEWSGRWNITRIMQANAIADVLRAVDADLVLVLEAPNEYEPGGTVYSLEKFARHFRLRTSEAFLGYANDTEQEIALLYDPTRISVEHKPMSHEDAPSFTQSFDLELPNAKMDRYVFSKPPLEVDVKNLPTGQVFHLIGAHLKSKAPHGAKDDEEALRIGFENRRKQIAQATWLRNRVNHIHTPLVVAGDFNDGPGLDDLERIIGASSLDVLIDGGMLHSEQVKNADMLSSARFYNRDDQSVNEVLLDYIFVNAAARRFAKSWRVWHPTYDLDVAAMPELQNALITASDHFPVTLDFAL